MKKRVLVMVIVVLSMLPLASATISVNGVPWNATVNNNATAAAEYGNYSIADVAADTESLSWDMTPASNSNFVDGESVAKIYLHPNDGAPWKQEFFFNVTGGTYRSKINEAHASSSTHALAYSSGVTAISIDPDPYYGDVDITGIGFALNRIGGAVPVSVYDDFGGLLASYTVGAGDGTNWFGYIGDTKIGEVVVDTSASGSFWLDDFTVTTSIPEPATICVFGLGMLGLLRRKK